MWNPTQSAADGSRTSPFSSSPSPSPSYSLASMTAGITQRISQSAQSLYNSIVYSVPISSDFRPSSKVTERNWNDLGSGGVEGFIRGRRGRRWMESKGKEGFGNVGPLGICEGILDILADPGTVDEVWGICGSEARLDGVKKEEVVEDIVEFLERGDGRYTEEVWGEGELWKGKERYKGEEDDDVALKVKRQLRSRL